MLKMASEMQSTAIETARMWPAKRRILQKRSRSSDDESTPRPGKAIPVKTQPDELCQCPQRCDEKVPPEVRIKLFEEFYQIGDHSLQNDFLVAHIRTRAVQRRSQELKTPRRNQRRVSCKYQIPIPDVSSPPIQPGPSPPGTKLVEICQKAFMNIFGITEKRVRIQRERLISCLSTKSQNKASSSATIRQQLQPQTPDPAALSVMPAMNTINTGTVQRRQVKIGQIGEVGLWRDEPIVEDDKLKQDLDCSSSLIFTAKQLDVLKERQHEIALVDNFFSNQLWKPEYINKTI